MSLLKKIISYFGRGKKVNEKNVPIKISIDPAAAELIHATHDVYHIETEHLSGYFKACKINSCGQYDTNSMARLLAYQAVSRLMKLEEYVPDAFYCVADISDIGKTLGTFQNTSKGENIWNMPTKERIAKITPDFQRNVSNLRLRHSCT